MHWTGAAEETLDALVEKFRQELRKAAEDNATYWRDRSVGSEDVNECVEVVCLSKWY